MNPRAARRILVVEDDPDCRSLLRDLLASEGYEVATVSTVLDTLWYLDRARPDLILLDLTLKDGDGHEVARRLGAHWKYFTIPIIVVTARANPEEESLARLEGVRDYVVKPFAAADLLDRVRRTLDSQEEPTLWTPFTETRPA